MANTITNKRKCDICGKKVDRWDITSVKKMQKYPGKFFDRCASDVRSCTTILANLCPTCIDEIENLINERVNK